MNKKKNISAKPLAQRNCPAAFEPHRNKQINQKQEKQKSIKKQNKNLNSRIPIRQNKKENKKADQQNQSHRNLKDLAEIQLFADPTNIELARKKQKTCEEEIKKQIENKRQKILNDSINKFKSNKEEPNSISLFENRSNIVNFSDSIEENEKLQNFNQQILEKVPQVKEEPFTVDLSPGSMFEKSMVKTPPPGFSIRKGFTFDKIIPTFPNDQTFPQTNTRLDSASEMIFPDGRKVPFHSNPI